MHFGFLGTSNYVPTGKVAGALPCGRKARASLFEGVSPFAGSDVSTPLAAMRSAAKVNHDIQTGKMSCLFRWDKAWDIVESIDFVSADLKHMNDRLKEQASRRSSGFL